MRQSDLDVDIRKTLENESLPDSVKRPVFERQVARLKAILDRGRPGWAEDIPDPVTVMECSDPVGPVAVAQHGDIE